MDEVRGRVGGTLRPQEQLVQSRQNTEAVGEAQPHRARWHGRATPRHDNVGRYREGHGHAAALARFFPFLSSYNLSISYFNFVSSLLYDVIGKIEYAEIVS